MAAVQTASPVVVPHSVSSTARWSGRILSGLVVLFMIFDGVTKVMKVPQVMSASTQLGFSASLIPVIGIIGLFCTALYAIPYTSILGAVLLTGYLGGAVVTQLRAGNPLFSEALFPVYFGVLARFALYLRDPRLRTLFAFRSRP